MSAPSASFPRGPPAESKRVSVVVVNWNGKHLLNPCLASLESQTYPDYEVIMVDNGSNDGSVSYVREHFPWVKVVESDTNIGYAGGCNLGARNATGSHVLLLNNDTRLAPDLLAHLAETLDRHPQVGAVSALAVEDLSASHELPPRISTLSVLGKHFLKTDGSGSTFYAPGACCMYRRDILVEPYDAAFFAYDEDVYMSWLLRLIGYEVLVDVRARFEHYAYSTSRRIKDYVVFCAERNRWTNLLLFYESRTLAKLAPLILLNVSAKVLTAVEGLRPKLRAYVWIACNFRGILARRAVIQRRRTAADELLTRHMTGQFATHSSAARRLVNRFAIAYLKLVGVPTSENRKTISAVAFPNAEGVS